jgi:hypothetical protein
METDVRQVMEIIVVLTPMMGIGCGISIGIAFAMFLTKALVTAFEIKYTSDAISIWDRLTGNLEAIAERLQKRKAQDHVYPEYPALDLGLERPDEPDGELIEWNEYEREARK